MPENNIKELDGESLTLNEERKALFKPAIKKNSTLKHWIEKDQDIPEISTKEYSDKKCEKYEKDAQKKIDKGKPIPSKLALNLLICESPSQGLLKIEGPSFELFAKTADDEGNEAEITVEPDFTTCEGEDTTVSGSESDNSESSSSDSGNSGSGSGSDNINSDSESE